MVSDTQQIPAGYKQTDVGVIPEDWEVKPLVSLISFSNGKAHEQSIDAFGKYIVINSKFISTNGAVAKRSNKAIQPVKKNDIVMVMSDVPNGRAIAKCFMVNRDNLYTLNQRICSMTPLSDDENYLLLQINRNPYYLSFDDGVKQTNLRREDVLSLQVKIPISKVEQKKISGSLSDIDSLISRLDQLIQKKKNIKQGVMQELLTGKRRLPGFSGEWEEKELNQIIQIPITDGPHLTPEFIENGIPFLSVNNLLENKIDFSDLRYISTSDNELFSRKCKPEKGDVLLGKAASVGKVAVVETDILFNIWSPIALIRLNNKNVPKYFYYQFQSNKIIKQISLLTNSSSQGNIGMGDIGKLLFSVPQKEEQNAVANVLSSFDSKIEVLQMKKNKYQDIKHGMMQQLLTGKIRLI